MVVPFGSALERRSRTTYRPTVTPEGSTHVDTAFTGTTSSFSRTDSGRIAVAAVVRQRVFAEAPWPDAPERLPPEGQGRVVKGFGPEWSRCGDGRARGFHRRPHGFQSITYFTLSKFFSARSCRRIIQIPRA
jgi:hypothetical protein